MQRLINTEYGDAIVEFTQYNEDGVIVNELIEVFLPESVPAECKTSLIDSLKISFYEGEGYNL